MCKQVITQPRLISFCTQAHAGDVRLCIMIASEEDDDNKTNFVMEEEIAAAPAPVTIDCCDKFFSYAGVKESSYRMKCLLCVPEDIEILVFKNSPSNLKKHIEAS